MSPEHHFELAESVGAFREPRPLIEREYWVFPCNDDLLAFVQLVIEDTAKKPPRPWKPLSTAEVKVLWNVTKTPTAFAEVIGNKLKEKNQDE